MCVCVRACACACACLSGVSFDSVGPEVTSPTKSLGNGKIRKKSNISKKAYITLEVFGPALPLPG